MSNPNSNPSGISSPTIVSVGDAPMSSVVAALVTISAVNFTNSSGTAIQLLSQPRNVELTQLGGIRAPLVLNSLPGGTYTSLSITVSAAQITYIDPTTGKVVMASATIPSASATTSITLTNPLVVSDDGATDIRFDFDLQKSLDLTNGVVTFTPVISAAVAHVKDEDNDNRDIDVNGTVTATSTSANTITVMTDDGLTVTLNVTSNTQFGDNLTLATLQNGTVIHTEDQLNDDGSLTATLVEPASGGGMGSLVVAGIVNSVTRDSSNNLTSFTLVVRDVDMNDDSDLGHMLTVDVNSSTVFADSTEAQSAGLTTFDQTQVFAGQAVWATGSLVTTASTPTELATQIKPAAVSPFGLSSATVQTGSSGGFVITMLLDANTNFDQFANITALTVDTNASTVFDGQTLTSATVASLPVGTPLVAHGFLSLSGTTATLFCDHLHEEGAGF